MKHYIKDYLEVKRTDYPKAMIIYVADRCNAKCGHCYWYKNKHTPVELTLQQYKKIAASIPKELLKIYFSGGEPFLNKDIVEVCKIFDTKTRSIKIPTNGITSEYTIKKAEEIINNTTSNIELQISIDGVGETHDKIRGVPGCYEKAIATIRGLKQLREKYPKRFSLMMLCVISNKNVNEIDSLIALSKELDVNLDFEILRDSFSLDISFLNTSHTPNKSEFNAPLSDIRKAQDKINEYYDGYKGIGKYFQRVLFNTKLTILEEKKRVVPCIMDKYFVVVSSNGDVGFCELLPPLGNLKDIDFDISKINQLPNYQRQKQQIKCCFCSHGCFLNPNIRYAPGYFLKETVKEFVKDKLKRKTKC